MGVEAISATPQTESATLPNQHELDPRLDPRYPFSHSGNTFSATPLPTGFERFNTAQLEEFAEMNGIDLSGATTNAQRRAVIQGAMA